MRAGLNHGSSWDVPEHPEQLCSLLTLGKVLRQVKDIGSTQS